MKKRSLILIFVLLVIEGFRLNSESVGASEIQEGIAKKIIRFHVIANSDSEEDQALKLEVKEEVLEYMKGLLAEASDVDESRKILKENAENICSVAKNAVRERGYDYEVNTFLEDRYFPVKTYGNYTFPPGVYEAFCVEIGSHQGKNWWCVMYPSLCMADAVHSVAAEETDSELKNILTGDEYEEIVRGQEKIQVKFKFIEWLEELVK